MTRPLGILGHRGARGLFPENTLVGFCRCWEMGVTAFELDVGMTADGVVMVSHDPALNPDLTRDRDLVWLPGPGPAIWSLSAAELRQFDVGRTRPGSATALQFPDQKSFDGTDIPSLRAALTVLPHARFTIEVKTDPRHPDRTAPVEVLTDATLAVIDAVQAFGRITVQSFDWRVQRHVRRVRPETRLAWLTCAATARDSALWWGGAASGGSVSARVAAEGGTTWAPDYVDLEHAQIMEAQGSGLQVLPWTVNDPADMRRLLDWGVDGLISDRPDLALNVAKSG